jgi:extradiol dioxygenase family protein
MITGIDHVQVAMPIGREDAARAFYGGLLGMSELQKPPILAARGGCAAGCECIPADGEIPGVRRFHTSDPFGNRIEFQQA